VKSVRRLRGAGAGAAGWDIQRSVPGLPRSWADRRGRSWVARDRIGPRGETGQRGRPGGAAESWAGWADWARSV